MTLADEVLIQLNELTIKENRPLIICDADEVLVQFVRALEGYLEDNGYYIDLSSFALTGNIRKKKDDVPADAEQVREMVASFFADRTEHVPAVPGAAEALDALAKRCQIVVLTNIPLDHREARIKGLSNQQMNYPVIANTGAKGAVVRHLAEAANAPTYFIDDIPQNISSVAQAAQHVHRIHFVADHRLAALLEPAEDCHHRVDDWPGAKAYIENHLAKLGF